MSTNLNYLTWDNLNHKILGRSGRLLQFITVGKKTAAVRHLIGTTLDFTEDFAQRLRPGFTGTFHTGPSLIRLTKGPGRGAVAGTLIIIGGEN
jgi:hypothetical protein